MIWQFSKGSIVLRHAVYSTDEIDSFALTAVWKQAWVMTEILGLNLGDWHPVVCVPQSYATWDGFQTP